MSTTTILNTILTDSVIPDLNKNLPTAIRNDNLDPLANVTSATTGGRFASATASVRNLTGLSSITIVTLAVSSVHSSGSADLTGTVSMAAHFNSPLAATLSASAQAIGITVGPLSGTVSFSQATVEATGSFQADLGTKICLGSLDLSSVSVDYDDPSINIPDLGVLNYLLKPLESAILDALKTKITSLLSTEVDTILSEQLHALLPKCL